MNKKIFAPYEILPLYSRLSNIEQNRLFQPQHGGSIILATNITETSLTVLGIKYAIESGTARISRYSFCTEVKRLRLSQFHKLRLISVKGVVSECPMVSVSGFIRIRIFLSRRKFTDSEILQTNLACIILQMIAIGLGDIAAFPFVEAPEKRNIQDGVQLLKELGEIYTAITGHQNLTVLGHQLARLPIDPHFARMVLSAKDHACMQEIMVITAALSIFGPTREING